MFILLITLFVSQTQAQIIRPRPFPFTLEPFETLPPVTIIEWCGDNAEQTGECDVGCETCRFPNQVCYTSGIIESSCLPEYVINTADNNLCVTVNSDECRAQRSETYVQLPPTCGPNEEFVYCGVCGSTCADPDICGKCVCLYGYLRNRFGVCIERDSIPCRRERRIVGPFDPITDISI